jgi:hypothetical protein
MCVLLSGCAMGTSGPPTPDAGAAITGRVMGAQAPLVGAQLYLLAANTTGYGGAGIADSSSNKSVSLLTSVPGSTTQDMNPGDPTYLDYYVTTSGVTGSCPLGGCFSITSDYSCTAGQQVYLYSLGGSQGGVANPVAGLLAVLGSCPSGGSFATEIPFVYMNEVSTIAAAYAMAGFATDALHVSSSGTALAQVGIANAFANAANLAGIATGAALSTTPAGNGTVPQNEINTLANILASCVNTNGAVTGPASATTCYTLFNDALSGGSSGALPSDTATAAINMAHNPAANITGLYGLSTGSPPFAPALSGQPNDFTVALSFTGGGLLDPAGLAVDGLGNIWVPNQGTFGSSSGAGSSVTELSSSGSILSGPSGFTNSGMLSPSRIAIDSSNNAWIANNGSIVDSEITSSGTFLPAPHGYSAGDDTNSVAVDGSGDAWFAGSGPLLLEYSNSGVAVSSSPYSGGGLTGANDVAVDGSGSVWTADGTGHAVKFSSAGTVLSGASGYSTGGCCIENPTIAIDSSGNAWITSPVGVVELSNSSGSNLSGGSGYGPGFGLTSPSGISIDGAGNVWVLNSASITELSSAGSVLSGANGYKSSGLFLPFGIALDGSGNVWVSVNDGSGLAGAVLEFVGTATPVITPIAAGLPVTPTGNGTSNLGTRP